LRSRPWVVAILVCAGALPASPARSWPAPPTPAAKGTPGALADLPWAAWFRANTVVSDKKTHVHFLWDANAVRSRFEGKEKLAMIRAAARQVVVSLYPAGATADQIRVDIVFAARRDGYGNPRWDSLQRVAHLEFSRRKLLEAAAAPDEPGRGFEKFEVFR